MLSPHAGTALVPLCGVSVRLALQGLISLEIYSNYVQEHLAPSGYLKIPTDIPAYLKGCTFLPQLNNELAGKRNSTYKERFSSLENLMLIMFEHDTVLMPKETSFFGYYPDGSFNAVLPTQQRCKFMAYVCAMQTPLYTEDWIGLKTLDEGHLDISHSDMKTYVVSYLKDEASTPLTTAGSSSSHTWLSSMWNFPRS
ncbi:hypothetical protein ACOSQ4_014049 [Xanthoceras sorbifolium]